MRLNLDVLQTVGAFDVANNIGGGDACQTRMEKEKSNGVPVNVGVPADVNARLTAWCERRRAVKRDVLGAIIDRFLTLPPGVQTAFIDAVDTDMTPAYIEMLERLAADLKGRGGDGPDTPSRRPRR